MQTRPGRTGYGPSFLMTERAGDQGILSIPSPRGHCGITRKRERPVACAQRGALRESAVYLYDRVLCQRTG